MTFFTSSELPEAAGFRACLRCRPQSPYRYETDQGIARARRYLDEQSDKPIPLHSLAAEIGLNPSYVQRTFTQKSDFLPKPIETANESSG